MHFLANPELFFTASRIALFSVMARPSRSHNLQSVSDDLFPLPVVDQVLEVYDRQPDLSPDAMAFSCYFFQGVQNCLAKKPLLPSSDQAGLK